jgi:hypothetical protein
MPSLCKQSRLRDELTRLRAGFTSDASRAGLCLCTAERIAYAGGSISMDIESFVSEALEQLGAGIENKPLGAEEWGQSSLLTQSDTLLAKKIGNVRL